MYSHPHSINPQFTNPPSKIRLHRHRHRIGQEPRLRQIPRRHRSLRLQRPRGRRQDPQIHGQQAEVRLGHDRPEGVSADLRRRPLQRGIRLPLRYRAPRVAPTRRRQADATPHVHHVQRGLPQVRHGLPS